MTVHITELNTGPPLIATLRDGAGATVDLTGATVVFNAAFGGKTIINRSSVNVFDALGGRVRYNWSVTDTLNPGNFDAEFEVTFSDGSVETFPRDGYFSLEISPALAAGGALLKGYENACFARSALITAALGTSTPDPGIDIDETDDVSATDVTSGTEAFANAQALVSGDTATQAAFEGIGAAIDAAIAEAFVGTATVTDILGLFYSVTVADTSGFVFGDPVNVDGTWTTISGVVEGGILIPSAPSVTTGASVSVEINPAPIIQTVGGKQFLLDIDGSGTNDETDRQYALRLTGA